MTGYMKIVLLTLTAALILIGSSCSNQEFTITAYDDCEKCCGRAGQLTATGIKPYYGICAVDPDVIPLHSVVIIDGMGCFRAEDTGRLIKGNRIDIYMRTHEEAERFGVIHRRDITW